MANRRDLKKNVNYITDLAAGLCIVESARAERTEEQRESISKLFLQVIDLKQDIISRISHTEPGRVKVFYKKLHSDFNSRIEGIFNQLEELAK